MQWCYKTRCPENLSNLAGQTTSRKPAEDFFMVGSLKTHNLSPCNMDSTSDFYSFLKTVIAECTILQYTMYKLFLGSSHL